MILQNYSFDRKKSKIHKILVLKNASFCENFSKFVDYYA